MRRMNTFSGLISFGLIVFVVLTIKYFYISLPAIFIYRWLKATFQDDAKTIRK